MLKICITGHRDLLNRENVRRDIAYSLKYFKETDNELLAISAVAAGADILFAEEAIRQQIPLRVLLPFHQDEYKKDFNGIELEKLEAILEKNTFEVVQKSDIKNQGDRNNAYLKIGQRMVDESDIVLAVWDGKPAGGKGGTGDIVEYARLKGKELHIIKAIREHKPGDLALADEAQVLFDKLDKEAVHFKKRRFVPAWFAGIMAGVLAVFCFAAGLIFPFSHTIKYILSTGEIIFLLVSFILLTVFAKKWKNTFLYKRRSAEYLRTVLWYKDAGIPIPEIEEAEYKPGSEVLTIEKKVAGGLSQIENIPNARRMAWCLADDQINYHQNNRIKRFHKKLERTEQKLKLIKIAFFVCVSLYFLVETMEQFHVHTFRDLDIFKPYLLFLTSVLPMVFAALEGIKYFSDWKRDIAVSEKTIKELKESRKKILACTDEKSLLTETSRLREVMEIENIDWTIRFHEKEMKSKL